MKIEVKDWDSCIFYDHEWDGCMISEAGCPSSKKFPDDCPLNKGPVTVEKEK